MLAGILTDETATLVFEIESPSGLVSKKEVKVVAKRLPIMTLLLPNSGQA